MSSVANVIRMPMSRNGGHRNGIRDQGEHDEQVHIPAVYSPSEVAPFPPSLREAGQARWQQLSQSLITRGIYSYDFFPSLELACQLYDQLEDLNKAIGENVQIITNTGPGGVVKVIKPHPLLKHRETCILTIRAFVNDFGMSPASTRSANLPVSKRSHTSSPIERQSDYQESDFA